MLLTALLLGLSLPASAGTQPTEAQIVAAAQAAAPQHAPGYLHVLSAVDACPSPCPAQTARGMARELEALEQGADEGRAGGKALRKLAGLIRRRIAAARAGRPSFDRPAPALEDPQARLVYGSVRSLDEELWKCADPSRPCAIQTLSGLASRALEGTNVVAGYEDETPAAAKADLDALRAQAEWRAGWAANLLGAFVDARLRALKEQERGLDRTLSAAEQDASVDLSGVSGRAEDLTRAYDDASVAADLVDQLLGLDHDYAAGKRDKVNAQIKRLAGLRSRALALRTARGLGSSSGQEPVGARGAASQGAGRPALAAFTPGSGAASPTLLDARAVPPLPSRAEPPPILKPGELASADMMNADAARRAGRTRTVGDPARYAPLNYQQKGPYNCSIAGQVQILRAHGLLPLDADPRAQERALQDEAESKGFMDGRGTYTSMTGELLVSRGLLVKKNFHAAWAALEAAVRRGHILQTGVDARYLWRGAPQKEPILHAVLVVGAEISKKDRALLGVYVNDTGDHPPAAARFVPADQFRRAFLGTLTEVE